MGVPFGFSVGDIIAGIGVIKTSIEAFSDTRGARKDHKQLLDTLTRLSESLELIRGIEVDPIQDARQRDVIRRAVGQCQICIEDFVCSIAKYKIIQPGLQPTVWRSRVKTAAKKVQWALCKKEDIAKLRSELGLQYGNINGLLTTLNGHHQRREAALQEADRKQNATHREVLLETRGISQQTHALVGRQSTALDSLRNSQTETRALVKALQSGMSDEQVLMLSQLLPMLELQTRTTQSIFNEITTFTAQFRFQTQIPPQLLLQQPVVFRDALDRVTPVHLEFIDSAEAFLAVLKVRFKHVGLRKLERDEYFLEDGKDNRSLDLRKPWSHVMQPGQHVTMSMIFKKSFQQNICPGCSSANEEYHGQETTCINCGRTYRLVEDERAASRYSRARMAEHENLSSTGVVEPTSWEAHIKRLRFSHPDAVYPTEDILDGEISDFRRVHLIGTSIPRLLEMAQTRSWQEEQAMMSMTLSVLEDIGQGDSPIVGPRILVLGNIPSDTTDSMLLEIFEPYRPIIPIGAFSESNRVYLTFEDGEHARSAFNAFRDKEIFPGYGPTKIEFVIE